MYYHKKIEAKWQEKWQKDKLNSFNLDEAPKPFYNLMMFPYPSAEGLHVGNMYAFTHSDCYGRFARLKGYDVFEPIGLDGFGIHSENYAIKINEHIKEVSKRTEKRFYNQLKIIGNQYDWTRTVETYKPNYYKWTQWLFLKMYEKGLAYRKKSPVNWCPSCKTVLSDEQVIQGKCERCDSEVAKKEMEQWFFKITDYAERLLSNLSWIDWSEEVKIGQKGWIGKSEGAEIVFELSGGGQPEKMQVFTTRPDTIFGATYLVMAPEFLEKEMKAWLADGWKIENVKELEEYIAKAKVTEEQERLAENKEKTGVEIKGVRAKNPLNGEEMPVFVADYVLMGYGTGAIMAVPAHDTRDFAFAKKFGLAIKEVVKPLEKEEGDECFAGEGKSINSGFLNGLSTKEAKAKIIKHLEKEGIGKKEINYKLRDWCVSRQRYWGPPIPMIYCEVCGWSPVPEKDLPVELPELDDFHPDGSGKGPLNKVKEFVETTCPKCGGKAKRETDVSDPFVDSSWYFFRYLNTENDKEALNKERMKKWMPVDLYFGGKEHTVLHLLYARFVTMVLNDLGYIDFEEPFKKFVGHGLVIKDGAKMSKSKGNVVNPDEYIERFGADSVRLYLMFLGDARQGGDWKDAGMAGMFRFVKRLWTLYDNYDSANAKDGEVRKENLVILHKTAKEVASGLERFSFNTGIARIMELVNWYNENEKNLNGAEKQEILKGLAVIISPFAPHVGEEFWHKLGGEGSVFKAQWLKVDDSLIREEEIELVVQVNGKLRSKIKVAADISEKKALELALKDARVEKFLEGKPVKKKIFVPGKLVNLVV